MTWDPVLRRVWLFGGNDAGRQSRLGDAWGWDGSAWASIDLAADLPAGDYAAIIYDDALGTTVLVDADGSLWALNPTSTG